MRLIKRTVLLVVLGAACAALILPAFAQERSLLPVADLIRQASRNVPATPRTRLFLDTAADLRNVEVLEPGLIPNSVRAFALIPGSAGPFARAFKTLLYGGTVEPETKMAMGLQMGRVLRSPYTGVHLRRLLTTTDRGRSLLRHLESGAAVEPARQLAVRYAEWLTEDVHGIDDERFRQVRSYYTDPQIVELTLTVSFFNYFTRLSQAVNLPIEPWALNDAALKAPAQHERQLARVGLVSDAQMAWAAGILSSRASGAANPASGLGLANSQRAMNLVPDIASAWRAYTGSLGADAAVSQEIKLQVSFAVSTANGCRYCTLHQVQGLRRLGVSPAKLLQMQKDDSALTPRELVAVTFARKLTRAPDQITDADYGRLRAEFGERGALEVVLQTCNFAFMNRFTDNLGLPSEDEAVKVYREVYGADWK